MQVSARSVVAPCLARKARAFRFPAGFRYLWSCAGLPAFLLTVLQTGYVPTERDVDAFEERAARYEQGRLGQLHREIVGRVSAVALACHPSPSRILDVGCGTGYQLRLVASRCPEAAELARIDAAPAMVKVAQASTADPRVAVRTGLPNSSPT